MRGFPLSAVVCAVTGIAVLMTDPVAIAQSSISIGFAELDRDQRYREWGDHPADTKKLGGYPAGRPRAGAELGILEAERLVRRLRARPVLMPIVARDVARLIDAISKAQAEQGVRLFLLDLPGEALYEVAEATKPLDLLLINVSSPDDRLRRDRCFPHLIHTAPSDAMLADALVQFLAKKGWRDVLVLRGPLPADEASAAAFRRAARRFGIKIVAEKPFALSNDPRAREMNRPSLMTAGIAFDVVFIADTDREFAYGVAYDTNLPRPVVGAAGLRPLAWHWSFTRHGAPQLNGRFEKRHKRRMAAADWAAWVAVKGIVEALLRTGSTAFADIRRYLLDPGLRLDGFKGGGYSFRPWSGQLRQRVLLVTGEWVVAAPPVREFLHPTNNLDTLGYDEGESKCVR